jgi:hypothetical protein
MHEGISHAANGRFRLSLDSQARNSGSARQVCYAWMETLNNINSVAAASSRS